MKKTISDWYCLGVNGKEWKGRSDFQDLFFSDYKVKPGIFSIKESLQESLSHFPNQEIIFIHLNSQQSRYYYYTLLGKKVNFLKINDNIKPARPSNIYNNKIETAIRVCLSFQKPLFFPYGNVRILNANFISEEQSYDEPYFIFIEDEDFLEAELTLKENNLEGVVNPLRLSSEVFSSFFLSEENNHWMNSKPKLFHNYSIEEKIFKKLSDDLNYPSLSEYQTQFNKELEIFERLSQKGSSKNFLNKHSREAACPVHIFLEKYYGLETNLNRWAKEVYGA